ncbi:MAG: hypothetical protein JXR25_11880 [Pontiellaceae bacterium]|nr:hypothetical protein [Pontiellaceae bacterium]
MNAEVDILQHALDFERCNGVEDKRTVGREIIGRSPAIGNIAAGADIGVINGIAYVNCLQDGFPFLFEC